MAEARHTLVAAGSQKHFIYVLDGSGCSVLLGTGGPLWSLAPPHVPPVPPDVNSPRLRRASGGLARTCRLLLTHWAEDHVFINISNSFSFFLGVHLQCAEVMGLAKP